MSGASDVGGSEERARLAALDSYAVLDTAPEQAFDDIARLAARLCGTPSAFVSLVDRDRQWFKARVGVDPSETPRNIAFCDHAIRGDAVMIVPDTARDPRFADNPLVTGDPFVRFYAGAPIIDSDGHALGTVCVIDTQPRTDFDGTDVLAALARQVAVQLELRRRIARDTDSVSVAENYRDLLWSRAIDVMVVTDVEGVVVESNPAWQRMFGPADAAHPITLLYAASETSPLRVPGEGEDGIQVQRRMMTANGDEVSIDWTLVRKNDLVFRIGRDQTRAIRAEEQLAHIQKMESLGQLTGGIAHDFNNLLTIILGNIETAMRRAKAGRTGDLARVLDHAREASERAANLTQRLLAFARRQSLDPVVIDPVALVTQLKDLFDRSLGGAHRVAYRQGDDVCKISIDPAQLENSLINLVVNARDAMPDGGTIEITVENVDLDSLADDDSAQDCQPGDYVRIAVRDEGIGMDAATRERVFEPFFTTKDHGKGTGLGLSQVMGFVAQSGGRVAVDTSVGKGTEISLWLPVAVDGEEQPGKRAPANGAGDVLLSPGRAQGNILLVEDNERLRSHVVELLGEAGYAIVEAVDGVQAVELLGSGTPPDLVLSDVKMPNLDGFQLSAEVRKRFPDMPILLMTGYAGKETPDYAAHDAMIAKPFTADRLLMQVETMLARIDAD
ncbi:ATP-binding protein [Flavisphingopyxis soli]|nr:ATP-binding protein [Sphingorhabdus soli]